MSSVQRLDKDIDSELFKIQRMREISLNVEKKMKINLKVKMNNLKRNLTQWTYGPLRLVVSSVGELSSILEKSSFSIK